MKYDYGANHMDATENLQYEFNHPRHQGLALDARIIGRTLRSVIGRRPLTDWRLKAAIHAVLSRLPRGQSLNYVLQRHVTRSLPPPNTRYDQILETGRSHLSAYQDHGPGDVGAATFFEFGAGWLLGVPLALAALGVRHQIVIDAEQLSRRELVLHSINRLGTLTGDSRLVRLAAEPDADRSVHDILMALGVDYRAPCDVRRTGLPDDAVDCITSTSTLEHVPAADLGPILRECFRILRPGGVMSHWIDYGDHYARFDPSITAYNFLTYEERAWRRYSSRLHHQNRLRHRDYMAGFEAAGFETVAGEMTGGSADDLAALGRLPLAAEYAAVPIEDLAITGAHVVLRKPAV